MTYHLCIQQRQNSTYLINEITDDVSFADTVSDALRNHPASPPSTTPSHSNALQGNICEFCVWDIGEQFWQKYDKCFTWAANAGSPWRASSDPGIDILAIGSVDSDPKLLIIEVKSSGRGGANLIFNDDSSLKNDFKHLFEGDVQKRLLNRLGGVFSELTFKFQRPDLVDQIKQGVGSTPDSCQGVKLFAVLIAKKGNRKSHFSRSKAFRRLRQWLITEGWDQSQIEFHSIEVNDFRNWLEDVIQKATI